MPMASAIASVDSTCGTVQGRSFGCSPRALLLPITWPIFMPPPAISADISCKRPVITAAVRIDLRRPAKLAPHDRHHVVLHTALVQVLDHAVGQALVHLFGKLLLQPP